MRAATLRFAFLALFVGASANADVATEAPTGFDELTNGFISQQDYDGDRAAFEGVLSPFNGLGPLFNGTSCAQCHAGPTRNSQITNLHVGTIQNKTFFPPPGGLTMIHDLSLDPSIHESVPDGFEVRVLRVALPLLGAGYVECIDDATLQQIAADQSAQTSGMIAGQWTLVPLLEAPGQTRVGRFGWKDQQASLLSMAAFEYLHQVGITNRFFLTEDIPNDGRSVAVFDPVPDTPPNGEDPDNDIDAFAEYLRSTKAPARDISAASPDAQAGAVLFSTVGCALCHSPTIVTAPPGTVINGGAFTVPPALGSKVIHPYSDFLLHDVGTNDDIVQNGGPTTLGKVRTAPLWGLRNRNRLMHDGASVTVSEAILRHGGEATKVIRAYKHLSADEMGQIAAFLRSL